MKSLGDCMATRHRRLAAFGLILLLIAIGGGEQLRAPRSVSAQANETFVQPLEPPKLYSGDVSHDELQPLPSLGLRGYCIDVEGEGHTGLGANNGFRIAPATYRGAPYTTGAIVETAYFDNGSSTTTDDVYCVSVVGTPRPQSPNVPGAPLEPAPDSLDAKGRGLRPH